MTPERARIRIGPIVLIAPVALVTLVALLGLAPVIMAMADLFRRPGEAYSALVDPVLWPRIGTSLLIALSALGLMLPLGLIMAWLLVRTNLPARRLGMMLIPFPLFLPPLVHVLSWFGVIPLSGIPAIVIVYVIAFTPFVVLLSARSFEQISRAHAETVQLMGGRRAVLMDDLRHSLPAATIGGVLALVFMLGDFAVADFLTSVGPKVTVYADTIYVHHLAQRSAAAAATAVPGILLCLVPLIWALRRRRQLGATVDPRFERAEPLKLGGMRWAVLPLLACYLFIGTVLPLISLAWQAGSWTTILEQARGASDHIVLTALLGAAAATGMVLLALPLMLFAQRLKRAWWLDGLIFLPLAVPPLILGVGLIRVWNRPLLDAIYLGPGVLLIAMIGRYLAFAALPIGGSIERLDRSMLEAARLAGAGRFAQTVRITLPLIAGTVVAAWCISYCFTLRDLDTLIMLRAGQRTLPFHLYSNVVFARQEEVAALALILAGVTIAPLLLYLAVARRAIRFP